jgi:NADH-quinone oxidoreductase subunit H
MIALVAELSRTPFDMPIAESELVMGYLTEYSGIRFTMFFAGEYIAMFGMSAIAATLFLGGWYLPGIPSGALDVLGPMILMGKVGLLVFLLIWFRWTFPRLREDQLQSFAWRWLIPLSLLNIMATAAAKVIL